MILKNISLCLTTIQGSTLIFKVTCPFVQVRFEIHLSCMRCHLSTSPNPCRNMGIVQFCATICDFSLVPSDKWHCKTTCPRSHFQHFYLSWTVGQPLRSSPAIIIIKNTERHSPQKHSAKTSPVTSLPPTVIKKNYASRVFVGRNWLAPGDILQPGDSLRPTISVGLSSRTAGVWHRDATIV